MSSTTPIDFRRAGDRITAAKVAKTIKAVEEYGAFVRRSDMLIHHGIDSIDSIESGMRGE